MARIYPDVDPKQLEHSSEESLYVALRDQLPSDFVVLHSYPWLRETRDLEIRMGEGEADFVILHRDYGLMVIEVKGGDVYYHNHAWFRRKASGDYQIKDPFDQARKSEHVLEKFITAQRPKLKNKFGYCHAVALPHARLDGALPANAKRALILSVDELDGVHEWVVGAFEAWRAPKLMEQRDFQLMCDVLMPEFRIYRPVGASLTQINEQLILLTEQQRDKLHGLRRSNRVIIDGVAGSGKTMLAVQRARDFALNGQRTLLTCYNAALADWLKEQVERDELLDGAAGELIVQNFHRFASTCIKRAGVQMEWREGDDDFWREAIGLHLEQAWDILRARGEAPFDAIVVDEGQDFEEGWWWTICALLKDEDASPLYIFQDPDQTIREIEDSLPLEIPTRYELSTNCRNTKEIAGLSARFAAREVRSLDRSPSGPWPSVIFAQGENQQRGQVFTAVREFISLEGLKPSQIALIGPNVFSKGALAGVSKIDDIPITDDITAWRRGGSILASTTRSFKGLEADAIILYDIRELDDFFTKADLYVAISRARGALKVIARGKEIAARLREALTTAREELRV